MTKFSKALIAVLLAAGMISAVAAVSAEENADETLIATAEQEEQEEAAAPELIERFKLDFSDATKADFTATNVARLLVQDGYVMVMSESGDPYLNYGAALELDAGSISVITLKVKAVLNEKTSGQLFFTTDSIGWSEAASFKYDMADLEADEDGFVTVTINTADSTEWKGTVTGLRFDLLECPGTVILDKVVFYGEAEAEEPAETEEKETKPAETEEEDKKDDSLTPGGKSGLAWVIDPEHLDAPVEVLDPSQRPS